MTSLQRTLTGSLALCLLGAARKHRVAWEALESAFSAYLRQPTALTAQTVTRLLSPGEADRREAAFDLEAVDRIYSKIDKVETWVPAFVRCRLTLQ